LTVLRVRASDVRDDLEVVLALIEERARYAVVVA